MQTKHTRQSFPLRLNRHSTPPTVYIVKFPHKSCQEGALLMQRFDKYFEKNIVYLVASLHFWKQNVNLGPNKTASGPTDMVKKGIGTWMNTGDTHCL